MPLCLFKSQTTLALGQIGLKLPKIMFLLNNSKVSNCPLLPFVVVGQYNPIRVCDQEKGENEGFKSV